MIEPACVSTAMKEFIRKHEARIHGVLSCFDRMLFRGYLPIMSACVTLPRLQRTREQQ